MYCFSTHNLLNYYGDTSAILVVDGEEWIQVKLDTLSTEPTKHVPKPDTGDSTKLLQWQPQLATKLNSAVLIWYIKTLEFVIVVVCEMIQRTADIYVTLPPE